MEPLLNNFDIVLFIYYDVTKQNLRFSLRNSFLVNIMAGKVVQLDGDIQNTLVNKKKLLKSLLINQFSPLMP